MTTQPSITHEHLADLAKDYAQLADYRLTIQQDLRAALARVAEDYLPELRATLRLERDARDALGDAVAAAPHLFERPRTRKVNGVEYGWRTGKPAIQVADEARTIGLIRKLLPEGQQVLLIRTREAVHKPACLDLTAADLRRLGIVQTEAQDAVVVRLTDDDTDRLVSALLADAADQAADETVQEVAP